MKKSEIHNCFIIIIAFALVIVSCKEEKPISFEPTFESLEQVNPVPEWFMDAKFGIYFHWGVYSVPAFDNEWYPRNMYQKGSPASTYHLNTFGELDEYPYHKFIAGTTDKDGRLYQFAPKMKSEGGNFNPAEWAQLFADAGAKFAGPVAEHHDGFSMWASEVNPWNAKDMGPNMDLVDLLTKEIRELDMKIILSMHHAYNITGFFDNVPETSDSKLQMLYGQMGKEKNEKIWFEKHKEIIDKFQPDIIWQDFNLTAISQPVLLEFLSYYYNQALAWGKNVVATYKDGLNTKCAVLDYERGGPTEMTEYYWLTDDAISSSSWCYTEGIGYYTTKQVIHGFFDRISKNGNLLLNISPKADGTIPQEQKDILLAMGAWLKKYGEAIYSTRAWEVYGEGPTKMGAAHGVFTQPKEGTSKDVRFTRSKNNNTLFAIMLDWENGQNEFVLESLSSERIDLSNLIDLSFINGETGAYMPLGYKQDASGLTVSLPQKPFDELAYVLKFTFDSEIPKYNKFKIINCENYYHLSPNGEPTPVLGFNGKLSPNRKDHLQQWKFEMVKSGIYKILNRDNDSLLMATDGRTITFDLSNNAPNQLWTVNESFEGFVTITNYQHSELSLSIKHDTLSLSYDRDSSTRWLLIEVCDVEQTAYNANVIPGIIEAEDFDDGCPGDAYFDKDEINVGGKYRTNVSVDIEECSAGGYNIGWTNSGEWLAYTVDVKKNGIYKLSVYVASVSDHSAMRIEFDGIDKTGLIKVPNTGGYQSWETLLTFVKLHEGQQVMKFIFEEANSGLNLDKMKFELE